MEDKSNVLQFPKAPALPVVQPQPQAAAKPKVKGEETRRGMSPFEKRREELRPKLIAQYGQLSDDEISKLVVVEMDKAYCVRCNGECSKEISRWRTPVVRVENSKAFVEYALCPVGVKRFERREFERAGIPEQFHSKTFADYKPSVDNNEGKRIAIQILHNNASGGYFYGNSGKGKTFLAALIAQDFVREFKRVRFLESPDEEFTDCDLLILDDIDTWSPTKTAIILDQCGDAKILATAKCSLDALEERLGSDNFAKRITSRLKATTEQAFFGQKDWRRFK